jgi:hypothetical protein
MRASLTFVHSAFQIRSLSSGCVSPIDHEELYSGERVSRSCFCGTAKARLVAEPSSGTKPAKPPDAETFVVVTSPATSAFALALTSSQPVGAELGSVAPQAISVSSGDAGV